jgi:hypothetical protein
VISDLGFRILDLKNRASFLNPNSEIRNPKSPPLGGASRLNSLVRNWSRAKKTAPGGGAQSTILAFKERNAANHGALRADKSILPR